MDFSNQYIESFEGMKEFLDTDPSFGFQISTGLVLKNYKNTYLRYSHWATSTELKGKSVLDIGCRVGAAGAYALANGANRYVGIDNESDLIDHAKNNLEKYFSNSDIELHYVDAEEFVSNCKEKFDFVFLGRVLHYINNGAGFLKAISKIADNIVFDDAHPPNFLIDYLIKNSNLNELELDNLLKKLELEYPIIETHHFSKIFKDYKNFPFNKIESTTKDFLGTAYSIGYLRKILNQENFTEDFSMYERIKKVFPEEYGYGIYKNRDGVKKYILRFAKTKG